MSDNTTMKIDIPGVNFEQLAREAIAARLTEAMVGADDAIRKIVVAAMEQKVTESGQTPRHSYEGKLPYIEWLAQELIRKAALDVMKTKMAQIQPVIERAIEAELKRGARNTAKLLAGSIAKQAASGYGFTAQIILKERD